MYLDETDVFLRGQQDVLWFQVSVDDPVTVEILHTDTRTYMLCVCVCVCVCVCARAGFHSNSISVSPGPLSTSGRSKVWPRAHQAAAST